MVSDAPRRPRGRLRGGAAAVLALVLTACGSPTTGSSTGAQAAGHRLSVVAAENVWGSIAAQLGGSQVTVRSIVTDPNADPHDYESDTGDARALATADYVILNGAGYDAWARKLLAANPSGRRRVLTVADLLGRGEGDNPHFWYSPAYVTRVADRIGADLASIDPEDAGYYRARRAALTTALAPYTSRVAAIRARFGGRRVAATESLFTYMAGALGLVLVGPPEFMRAVAEGNDPPVASVAAFQQALTSEGATVLIYNLQTSTDVTNSLEQMARRQGIPVVGVSETMQPPDATFEAWQLGQLDALSRALDARAPAGR